LSVEVWSNRAVLLARRLSLFVVVTVAVGVGVPFGVSWAASGRGSTRLVTATCRVPRLTGLTIVEARRQAARSERACAFRALDAGIASEDDPIPINGAFSRGQLGSGLGPDRSCAARRHR
jgi:hypothetical protein